MGWPPTFWDHALAGIRQPLFWICWLLALGAFAMTWRRDTRPYAPIVLLSSVQFAVLTAATGTILTLAGSADEFCPGLIRIYLGFLPALWAPVVLLGIPVVLQARHGFSDRSFRRAWFITSVGALDVLGGMFASFTLVALSCSGGHGWRVLLDP